MNYQESFNKVWGSENDPSFRSFFPRNSSKLENPRVLKETPPKFQPNKEQTLLHWCCASVKVEPSRNYSELNKLIEYLFIKFKFQTFLIFYVWKKHRSVFFLNLWLRYARPRCDCDWESFQVSNLIVMSLVPALLLTTFNYLIYKKISRSQFLDFTCPGSSIPVLDRHWVSEWVTATLEGLASHRNSKTNFHFSW